MKKDMGSWSRDRDGFYSEQILRIAAHRIRGLMRQDIMQTASLEKILKSAYLQGIVDAAESIKLSDKERGEGDE
ncbi:MAG: hypothetical protein BWY21_00331 [Parcubacteria group bacterium ADurb.Bin216]|nr:MAG: hypothetical protein BWY21_00331 [Parcubacteria group bacterium ADurb.Bin216]